MTEDEKDLKDEQARVASVQETIEKKREKTAGLIQGLREKVIDLRKNFWEDVTVNLDEADDVNETQASLKQQAELLGERERTHQQIHNEVKTLDRLQRNPYFGRIDFREEGAESDEEIYVGLASLMDEKEEDFLIYDWRAPISSMYYDFSPGGASYETIEGKIQGDMTLKRQFIIRNGKLEALFDTGVTIGDSLLQYVLGGNASTEMKSIVATIQKEQNQIIRNESAANLIVQGAAGSGKTSAALQRVAYLLYHYRDRITAENIVLLSPNPLFNSYVSNVLPELGEDNMKQATFYAHMDAQLEGRETIETPFEQMEYMLLASGEEKEQRLAGIQYKASLDFKRYIDDKLDEFKQAGLIFKDVSFRKQRIVSKQEIQAYFYSLSNTLPISNRAELTAAWIVEKLQLWGEWETRKDWVREEVELMEKEDYVQAFSELQKKDRTETDDFEENKQEEEILRKWVVERKLRPLIKKVRKHAFINVKKSYLRMLTAEKRPEMPASWTELYETTKQNLIRKYMNWEDVTPFVYFRDKVLGDRSDKTIRYVLIDEAQDYSAFQFAYLQQAFPNARMTLLGDINQAIQAHALTGENVLSGNTADSHRIELWRSYRSTRQIVDFTKELLDHAKQIQPFNRDGDLPTLTKASDDTERRRLVLEKIRSLQESGYETIAVIAKTSKESKVAHDWIKEEMEADLITETTSQYKKGLSVIPAYLAKGIEFDAVILYDVSDEAYGHESERTLLYTACTRAMHELHMYSVGNLSPFIEAAADNTYKSY
ncbi:RNA polymerase recycling motor HelD [Terribacillus saccharophilus]|uniref:RNA polymerase recycling motor HelD n=1 Tax=Terribacillus saccharophilus TaxID=361277 RepID=UPI002DC88C93|nr:RNA polymerase recycling motor HelD [Terribacillus saccharophilus]